VNLRTEVSQQRFVDDEQYDQRY